MPTPPNDLKALLDQCLDSPGYVVFAAILTPQRDQDGYAVIDHHYRRYHFALEDSKSAITQFERFVHEEIDRLMKGGDE